MTCPISNIKRVLYVKTQSALGVPAVMTATDAVRTISADFSISEEGTIDRSDVWSGFGGGAKNITGSLGWEVSLQTEFYGVSTLGTNWALYPLFAGSPVNIVSEPLPDIDTVITPSLGACSGTDILPFSLEIHEEGGAIWQVTDCTATWTMSAEPSGRILIDWTITGDYRDPVDTPTTGNLVPDYSNQGLPLVYRDAKMLFSYYEDGIDQLDPPVEVDLPNCPSFEFDPAVETSEIPSACTVGGRALRFLENTGSPVFTFSGVIREKPSLQPLFNIATKDKDVSVLFRIAAYDVAGDEHYVHLNIPAASLSVPELTELDRYLGVDLTIVGYATASSPTYSITFGDTTI